jgi:hypothetical protein
MGAKVQKGNPIEAHQFRGGCYGYFENDKLGNWEICLKLN